MRTQNDLFNSSNSVHIWQNERDIEKESSVLMIINNWEINVTDKICLVIPTPDPVS